MRVNIGELLTNRTRRDPHLEALVDTALGQRFTYAEINMRVNRAASLLLDRGIEPGDRVGLLLMNGTPFYEAYFACAKIGAVAVPLNWRLVADELGYILGNSGAKTLLFDTEFAALVESLHTAGSTEVEDWLQGHHDADLRHPPGRPVLGGVTAVPCGRASAAIVDDLWRRHGGAAARLRPGVDVEDHG